MFYYIYYSWLALNTVIYSVYEYRENKLQTEYYHELYKIHNKCVMHVHDLFDKNAFISYQTEFYDKNVNKIIPPQYEDKSSQNDEQWWGEWQWWSSSSNNKKNRHKNGDGDKLFYRRLDELTNKSVEQYLTFLYSCNYVYQETFHYDKIMKSIFMWKDMHYYLYEHRTIYPQLHEKTALLTRIIHFMTRIEMMNSLENYVDEEGRGNNIHKIQLLNKSKLISELKYYNKLLNKELPLSFLNYDSYNKINNEMLEFDKISNNIKANNYIGGINMLTYYNAETMKTTMEYIYSLVESNVSGLIRLFTKSTLITVLSPIGGILDALFTTFFWDIMKIMVIALGVVYIFRNAI